MEKKTYVYGRQSKVWLLWSIGSLALLLAFSLLLVPKKLDEGVRPITVYCAASIRMPLEEIAQKYEAAYRVPIRFDYGSSGSMEVRMRMDVESNLGVGDIYIPADESFAQRCLADGITRESIPLASFHLVLAYHPDLQLESRNMDELLQSGIKFCISDTSAAAGQKTKEALMASGHWGSVQKLRAPASATVVEAAHWIKESEVVQAGFIWNTTARQFGLNIIELPELQNARASISANLSTGSNNVSRALHFMRYLQSPEHGSPVFQKYNFKAVNGESWVEVPALTFSSGGFNREFLADQVKSVENRERMPVRARYAERGTFVAIKKNKLQDYRNMEILGAYLTGDVITTVENNPLFEIKGSGQP